MKLGDTEPARPGRVPGKVGTLGGGRTKTYLLSPHLNMVVGGGDNNIFRGKVSHVHRKLIGVAKGLDTALSPRSGCGQNCYKLGT